MQLLLPHSAPASLAQLRPGYACTRSLCRTFTYSNTLALGRVEDVLMSQCALLLVAVLLWRPCKTK